MDSITNNYQVLYPFTINKHVYKLSEAASVLDILEVLIISPTNLLDNDNKEYKDNNPYPILL